MKKELTQEELKRLMSYDPGTGEFQWLVRVSIRIKVGGVVGNDNGNGYVRTRIYGSRYFAHRLVFLYMTGQWPPEDVDHIDGCRSNNRWANLRLVSHLDNCKNQRPRAKAIDAPTGVHWDRSRGKWKVDIKADRKRISIGRFDSLQDAIDARQAAELKYSFHENHGKFVRGLANRRNDEWKECIP